MQASHSSIEDLSADKVLAPLQRHELRIEVTENDLPADRFSDHVNNARYFAFINQTFQSWYRLMGLRDREAGFRAPMAHCSYDFIREVRYPGTVLCRIQVSKVGSRSLEHLVEIWDVSNQPQLAGRGRVVHVGFDRHTRKTSMWPEAMLAQCWNNAGTATADRPPA